MALSCYCSRLRSPCQPAINLVSDKERAMNSQAIQLPPGTRQRLTEFRGQVRRIKLAEGFLAGLFGLAVSYVVVFAVDRFVDTPAAVRMVVLIAGCLGFGL